MIWMATYSQRVAPSRRMRQAEIRLRSLFVVFAGFVASGATTIAILGHAHF